MKFLTGPNLILTYGINIFNIIVLFKGGRWTNMLLASAEVGLKSEGYTEVYGLGGYKEY